MFYSKQSDISSYYRNNAFYNNYALYNSGYGMYNTGYYNYDSMLDDDKTMTVFGASVGWGKRLRWPDDFFQLSLSLGYTRYMLRDWSYFYIHNGNCNNINLGVTLSRVSTDNQLFPRRGSEMIASVTATPPWSLFDNKDYAHLAKNSNSATYGTAGRLSLDRVPQVEVQAAFVHGPHRRSEVLRADDTCGIWTVRQLQ